MNDRIKRFIEKQTCATICCMDEQQKPYCFNIFYAFASDKGLLYFKSTGGAKHTSFLNMNPCIAGTILPDKLNLLQIKGIQFEGSVFMNYKEKEAVSSAYYAKHPLARAVPGELWTVRLDHIKFTDNSLGFGTK